MPTHHHYHHRGQDPVTGCLGVIILVVVIYLISKGC